MVKRTLVSALVVAILWGLVAAGSGCAPKTAPSNPLQTSTTQSTTTSAGNHLTYLQRIGTLSVDFFGLVTFSSGASTTTFPSVFFVHSVPIAWTGTFFKGQLEEKGAGEDITDRVQGTVSADGNTLASLVYSRVIIRAAVSNGTSYTVTLATVPIASGSNFGLFQLAGADVEKYVSGIQYADGQLSGTQIVSSFDYVSTDWNSPNPSQQPTLKVNFGG